MILSKKALAQAAGFSDEDNPSLSEIRARIKARREQPTAGVLRLPERLEGQALDERRTTTELLEAMKQPLALPGEGFEEGSST